MNRTTVIKSLIIACLLFIFPLWHTTQAQILNEFTTVDSLQVGDTFDFAITLSRETEYDDISFPDSSHFEPTFEIRSRQQFKVTSYKDSIHYQLQFFGTADTLIPKLPIQLVEGQDTTTIYTKPVPVGFHSVLAENEDSFRPLKPIFEFARTWWPYLLALVLLIVGGYYGYKYYLQHRKKEEVAQEIPEFSPTPFTNPLKEFRQSIQELEQQELNSQEDFKIFYSKLGDAIRQYYESLYNLPALESTSRELLNMLRNGAIDQSLIDDTRAVLQEADMVKFAKFNPTDKQAERALKKAYNFLDRAKEIDGPRIDHMRRKHQTKMEAKREEFYQQHQKESEVEA
ncbi:hypothetical protein [Fodinibius sp. Rm-B-1B1-1]|uniref:hypothetical protein n=1 Tax=Fodinibius alkaliphilus TaxID=3140241 RepID=UPI003159DDB5